MRICHLTEATDPSFGGLYTATRGLASALARFEHVESPVVSGVGLGECSTADLCHAHGMWARSALGSLSCRLLRHKPLVVAPHGMLDEWALARRAAAKRIALATYEGLRLRRASCIQALCEAEVDSIRRVAPRAAVFLVPNGVDLPNLDEVRAMRASHVAQAGQKTLLYLGRIDRKKGIDVALRAFGSAARSDDRVRDEWLFAICGGGDPGHAAELRRLIAELGIEDSVRLEGAVEGEMKHHMLATSSAFVLTSRSEGLPMAALEAWAYGLPSLLSQACNLSTAASAGGAIIATASQPAASGMAELLRLDDREAEAMGARARAYVERSHAWDRIARRMMEVYRWTLGAGPRPDLA